MINTIIFDLDGTILDTLQDLTNSVNFALLVHSFPLRTIDDIRRFIGNGTIKLIERSCPTGTDIDTQKQVHKIFKEHYLKHYKDNTSPYKGIKDLLLFLKQKGYKLAVVSNKDHDVTKDLINEEFPNVFDAVQGSYHDQPKKPHPYLISKTIKELNSSTNDCLYIGDTNVDYQSAANCNLSMIAVSYGYRTYEELKTYNFDCPIAKEVKDIYQIIQTLETY